jgi:glycosyltransferase involved in cell wall biosynthesis
MEDKLAGQRAVFTGYKCGDELAELFASADLFVFPSTTDTFGNVVLEAQASGLPVVATNIGGPQENIEPDETGVIVNEVSGAAFANAITTLALDVDRRGRMGQHARRATESRNIYASFERLWEMYRDDEAGRAQSPSPIFEAVANLVDPAILTK